MGTVWVWLRCTGTGQSPRDANMQREEWRLAGWLGGWARRVNLRRGDGTCGGDAGWLERLNPGGRWRYVGGR